MATFTWPAAIDISDARTAAGEPLTEDLMRDYRDRDDYLQDLFDNDIAIGHAHSGAAGDGPQISPVDLYGVGSCNNASVVIDDTMDWRDRYIHVAGMVISANAEAAANGLIPGGANDDLLDPGFAGGNWNSFMHPMYTEDGGANQAAHPYIDGAAEVGAEAVRLWVRNTDGALMLYGAASANFWRAYNLLIDYSPMTGEI